jgi:hypothetical protein
MVSTIADRPQDLNTLIQQTVQTIQQVDKLGFDAGDLRNLLDRYLRIMEGEDYFVR